MVHVFVDEYDPAYDSADDLYDRAFGIAAPKDFDWSAVADLSEEDNNAMTEIDVAMEAEWMHRHQSEQADVEDEGKAFFAFEVNRTLQSSGFTVN
jgi:ligand-binding SRPBCC domain-containing protein